MRNKSSNKRSKIEYLIMGQYFKVVNTSKKQYYNIEGLGDNPKLGGIGVGLNGIVLSRLLLSPGEEFKSKIVGKNLISRELTGFWIGDKVIIAGDYDEPNTNNVETSSETFLDYNLYSLVSQTSEYEDITDKILFWLIELGFQRELAKKAKGDTSLLKKLSEVVFVKRSEVMKIALENELGHNWPKLLK